MSKSKKQEEYKLIKKFKNKKICFTDHFYIRMKQRTYLSKELIKEKLSDFNSLVGIQSDSKHPYRFRLAFKISRRYTLVLIVEVKRKTLYIITAWKTSKKWQKAIQK